MDQTAKPVEPTPAPADEATPIAGPRWVPDRVEQWPLSRLRPADRNVRTHGAEDLAKLRAWMREYGFPKPILARADGRIIAGHGRWTAAILEGFATVPVIVAPADWSDRQCREFALIDNQSALLSDWDNDLRAVELSELAALGTSIDELGFEAADLRKLGLIAGPPKAPPVEQVLRPVYQVLIECATEAEQLALLKRLQADGVKVRALVA
jgi:ParB-like chromosome segregation protein Spo0J